MTQIPRRRSRLSTIAEVSERSSTASSRARTSPTDGRNSATTSSGCSSSLYSSRPLTPFYSTSTSDKDTVDISSMSDRDFPNFSSTSERDFPDDGFINRAPRSKRNNTAWLHAPKLSKNDIRTQGGFRNGPCTPNLRGGLNRSDNNNYRDLTSIYRPNRNGSRTSQNQNVVRNLPNSWHRHSLINSQNRTTPRTPQTPQLRDDSNPRIIQVQSRDDNNSRVIQVQSQDEFSRSTTTLSIEATISFEVETSHQVTYSSDGGMPHVGWRVYNIFLAQIILL